VPAAAVAAAAGAAEVAAGVAVYPNEY